MNKRDYKNFDQGIVAHIYNRGNNKERIFLDPQDYRAFLYRLGLALGIDSKELNKNNLTTVPFSRIRIYGAKNQFQIHAFCLMPNHFHLLIEQLSDVPISKLVSKVCTSYSKYINQKYKKIGHLFQDCFKATMIESDSQLLWTTAYIHMNPVKDKITDNPYKYIWSSYNDYLKNRNLSFITTDFVLNKFKNINDFKHETLNYSVKETL